MAIPAVMWKGMHSTKRIICDNNSRKERTELAQVSGDKMQSEEKGLCTYKRVFFFLHKPNGNHRTKIED